MTRPGPGPKPAGPTHPTPTRPGGHTWRDCGHRADYASEAEHDRDCPAAEDSDARVRDESTAGRAAGVGQLPTLDELLGGLRTFAHAFIQMAGRNWDPASGPGADDEPYGSSAVDRHLGAAVADVRSAVRELQRLTLLLHPPSGSIEPADHPHRVGAGEAVTPGYVAASAPVLRGAESSHRLPPPSAVGAASSSGPGFDVPRPGAGQQFAMGTAFLHAVQTSPMHRSR